MTDVLHLIDATVGRDMAAQLSRLAGDGETVLSLGPGPAAKFDLARPVELSHVPLGMMQLARWRVPQAARGVGIIHAWSLRSAVGAVGIAGSTGCKVVASLPTAPGPAEMAPLIRAAGKVHLKLTVPTEAAAARLLAMGVREGDVFVLRPAAAIMQDRRKRRGPAREALGIGDSCPVLISPAELILPARQKLVLLSHEIMLKIFDDLKLIVPSAGPYELAVRRYARAIGTEADVLFCEGKLSLADALAAADVAMLLHSRDCGVGALAEAIAAGLPIVAADNPEITECTDGDKGALVVAENDPRQAGAAAMKLLTDGELAESLAAASLSRARQLFDPASLTTQLRDLYRSL